MTGAVLRRADWLHGARAFGWGAILALLLAIAAGFAIHGRQVAAAADPAHRPVATDFVSFYAAGQFTLRGMPALAYDGPATNAAQHALAQLQGGFLGFYYPPMLLPLCAAVATLPFGLAWLVWSLGGYLPLALALRRLLPQRWAWLPLLSAPAMVITWANGQSGFLPAACLAWGAVLLERRPLLAGVCLSGMIVKPHMAVAAPVALLAARRGRAVAGFAAGTVGQVVITLTLFGVAPWRGFVSGAAVAQNAATHFAPHWHKLLSLITAFRLLGAPLGVAVALQLVGSLVGLAVVAWVALRRPGAVAEMAVAAAATPLIAPHVLDYDLPILLLPMAWVIARAQLDGWRDWEKLTLASLYVLPLFARLLTFGAGVPVGPPLFAAGLYVCVQRARRTTA